MVRAAERYPMKSSFSRAFATASGIAFIAIAPLVVIWVGAGTTAVLFTVGNFLIGLYLGRSSVASAYGAAGSLVLLLIWVYYSAQILFYGAELTQVYARRHGSRLGLPAGERAVSAPVVATENAASAAPARSAAARMPSVPTPEPARPPTSEVGKGLAFSAALLLLGLLKGKRR